MSRGIEIGTHALLEHDKGVAVVVVVVVVVSPTFQPQHPPNRRPASKFPELDSQDEGWRTDRPPSRIMDNIEK